MWPIHHLCFFFNRFCLISRLGRSVPLLRFPSFLPSQCALYFWNTMGKCHPAWSTLLSQHTSCLSWCQGHCLVHLSQTLSRREPRALMAPMLYSRRQVEWEPASSLIEGVCLTLQRQPIISFLPHLRSLINVCVNLVSSQVATLRNFAQFNSAIDFSKLKIYRSTTLCPWLTYENRWLRWHWKQWGTFQGGTWETQGPIPAETGCRNACFPRTTLTITSKLRWELRAASWRVGCWSLHNWLKVEIAWEGEPQNTKKAFFSFFF